MSAALPLTSRSVDADAAGAGLHLHGRAAAVHVAGDVVAFQAALHADGLVGVNGAGAGLGIQGELRSAEVQVDGAGAGFDLPIVGRLACDADVTRAGLRLQSCPSHRSDGSSLSPRRR